MLADIGLTRDAVLWLGGPATVSLAVLVTGHVLHRNADRRVSRAGFVIAVIGIIGLVLSAAWVVFLFYVDAVLGDY